MDDEQKRFVMGAGERSIDQIIRNQMVEPNKRWMRDIYLDIARYPWELQEMVSLCPSGPHACQIREKCGGPPLFNKGGMDTQVCKSKAGYTSPLDGLPMRQTDFSNSDPSIGNPGPSPYPLPAREMPRNFTGAGVALPPQTKYGVSRMTNSAPALASIGKTASALAYAQDAKMGFDPSRVYPGDVAPPLAETITMFDGQPAFDPTAESSEYDKWNTGYIPEGPMKYNENAFARAKYGKAPFGNVQEQIPVDTTNSMHRWLRDISTTRYAPHSVWESKAMPAPPQTGAVPQNNKSAYKKSGCSGFGEGNWLAPYQFGYNVYPPPKDYNAWKMNTQPVCPNAYPFVGFNPYVCSRKKEFFPYLEPRDVAPPYVPTCAAPPFATPI